MNQSKINSIKSTLNDIERSKFEADQQIIEALHDSLYAFDDAMFLAWRNAVIARSLIYALYPAGEKRDNMITVVNNIIEQSGPSNNRAFEALRQTITTDYKSAHGIAD